MLLAALAFQSVLTEPMDTKLLPLVQDGAWVGVHVSKLDGTVLYERNARARYLPASNQKLLTAAYALYTLGPDFRTATRFWREKNSIIVDAPGNPTLTYADLVGVRDKLKRAETVQVRQAYQIGIPPTWEHDDLPNRYAAAVSAFTVDRGGFELWSQDGKAVLRPAPYGVRIVNLPGETLRVDYDPFQKIVRVRGPLPKQTQRLDTLAMPQPDASAASLLGSVPVPFRGELPTRDPDAVITSPPLRDIVKDCLVRSDNNLAENLLLLAAAREGELGARPYATATQRMRKFLVETIGIPENEVRPADGSGLSRHNLVTPNALSTLLRWSRTTWGETWTEALASPGAGTLSSRLDQSSFRGKTGTLSNVSSLSGYVKSADGQELVVSLVFNYYLDPAARIRVVQDEIVRMIESTTIGTGFELEKRNEIAVSHPSALALSWHRFPRPGGDSGVALTRVDRRVEPVNARAH